MKLRRNAKRYEERLREIGMRLDSGGYHSVTILEVDGGLVVRASAPGARTPEVLEIVDGDKIPAFDAPVDQSHVPHRLFPGGYARFLAALGRRLDRSRAAAISIVEGTDFVTVGGIKPVAEAADGVTYEPLDILLLVEDIAAIYSTTDSRGSGKPESDIPNEAEASAPEQKRSTGITGRLTSTIDSVLRMVQIVHHPARGRSS